MDAQQGRQDAEAPPPAPDDPGAAEAEPLLAAGGGPRRGVPWLTVAGFAFLTLNSGMAIRRSRGERGAVAFVAFSYVDLLLLFACLRLYETAEPGSAARPRLKAAVWALTTALTVLFSAKVAAVMPAAVAVAVWVMAFATDAGGFYAFFLYDVKHGDI